MKNIRIAALAIMFVLLVSTAGFAVNLVEVDKDLNFPTMLDMDSVVWEKDQIKFDYYTLARTELGVKHLYDLYGVKGTAIVRYKVIMNLYDDKYWVEQTTLLNAQGKTLKNIVDESGSQSRSESHAMSKCFNLIVLNPATANDLGMQYYNSGQYDKAIPLLEKSAAKGDKEANLALGKIYANFKKNPTVRQNYKKAFKYLSAAYQQGDRADAACYLGVFYYYGFEVRQNYSKAMNYFNESKKNRCPAAYAMLGIAYYEGEAVNRDLRKARKYLEESESSNEKIIALYNEIDETIREQELQQKESTQRLLKGIVGIGLGELLK